MRRQRTIDHRNSHSVFSCCALFLLCGGLLFGGTVNAEDWAQFRGPNCSGVSTSKLPLPTTFSATENVAWSATIGDGIGCPIVAAGRVFVSAMIDDGTIGLLAFDAASGRKLWERRWPTGKLPEVHKTNSHAATTAAADGERVYFYFSTLGMMAVDADTGADVWQMKLPVPYFVFKWGAGMSPVLYKNMVLFVQDDDLNPAFYAFDKKSGKLLWKDDRSDQAVNYSHPVICQTDRGDEIVIAGTGSLVGYSPQTGKRLWTARTLLRNIKTTPVSMGGVIYVSLQSSGIANQWLATADRSDTGNKDGKLSKAEMQAFVGEEKIPETFFKKTFDRGDVNKDGFLEGRELDLAFLNPDNFAGARFDVENPADEFILAIRGGGRGDVTESHLLWKHNTKHTDHIVSPLVVDGRMLLIKGGGIGTCFETQKGESLWGPKRIQNAGEYFASPVYGDGKIYVAGENGNVVVLENGPDLKILAKNDLGESVLGTPAIADGRLFFRTRTSLICVAN
jgi:outer membrane protein assembly factor BamB